MPIEKIHNEGFKQFENGSKWYGNSAVYQLTLILLLILRDVFSDVFVRVSETDKYFKNVLKYIKG